VGVEQEHRGSAWQVERRVVGLAQVRGAVQRATARRIESDAVVCARHRQPLNDAGVPRSVMNTGPDSAARLARLVSWLNSRLVMVVIGVVGVRVVMRRLRL
jgi:hypothetical protein